MAIDTARKMRKSAGAKVVPEVPRHSLYRCFNAHLPVSLDSWSLMAIAIGLLVVVPLLVVFSSFFFRSPDSCCATRNSIERRLEGDVVNHNEYRPPFFVLKGPICYIQFTGWNNL